MLKLHMHVSYGPRCRREPEGLMHRRRAMQVHDAASASESAVVEADLSAEELAAGVSEAYECCGFSKDPSLGMVQMMTAVETRLNDCLAAAATVPPELLEAGEKVREKGRRQVHCVAC